MAWLKAIVDGFLLSIQFFSVIPIRKEISIDKKRLKNAILTFPLLGAAIGISASLFLWVFYSFTPLSQFAISILFFFYFIFITGGIHLDGWTDTSDAYFSYRDQTRRLEIMKDPRVGTFGVLSLLSLLMFRFLFIFEFVQSLSGKDYFVIAIIPIFSRILMGTLLIYGPGMAKKEGLGFFFSEALSKKDGWIYFLYVIILLVSSIFIAKEVAFIISVFLFVFIILYYFATFTFKHAFGGLTGDTLGASIEGTETMLWLIVWLLHSYAMV
ncbi:adenosylcobinamide-GDP ribazoletransferase [Bacillus alveayuensis]|jgi:adenosylcobinamide-GDP ribazoletransferase|uniref:Adenosylcobinamide-GDP ribazoletransferase n=1 Tax=Aeribacillus alveayuensis TaxID=279215 RepID=A0ABT9VQZ9_9BACI|nr:adenosylcobinamide-GDP ribazoletransferase [Bacillus alveayuensis]MDQ0163095.1 adenosylcobinamide-GDP ribazoletransferase [Bacillus alveayuensis]